MKELESVWDFVEIYYPNYSSSDKIALEGDLTKLLDGEWEEGDSAHELMKTTYKNREYNPRIEEDHVRLCMEIYRDAIWGYIQQKNK